MYIDLDNRKMELLFFRGHAVILLQLRGGRGVKQDSPVTRMHPGFSRATWSVVTRLAGLTHPNENIVVLAGSVKRHCLKKGDEEGALCDFNPVQPPPASAPIGVGGADTVTVQAQAMPASAVAVDVECEAELEGICAATESMLAPVWAEGVEGVSEQLITHRRDHDLDGLGPIVLPAWNVVQAPYIKPINPTNTHARAMSYSSLPATRSRLCRAYKPTGELPYTAVHITPLWAGFPSSSARQPRGCQH